MKIFAILLLLATEWLAVGHARPGGWSLPEFARRRPFGLSSQRQETSTDGENKEMHVEVIEPGLVVIRNFLSEKQCKHVAQHAMTLGKQGEDGFYTTNEAGEKVLNTGEDRGRIYDSVHRFKDVSDYTRRLEKTFCEPLASHKMGSHHDLPFCVL